MIKSVIIKLRLFSVKRKEPYLLFHKVLGFYPNRIEYYELAMRHRSAAVPTDDGIMLSNERLEFLGDAVLNSVVTDILYRQFENQREGFLTNTRSKIVKRETLNKIAVEIGLDKLMLASKHIQVNKNSNLYGNAFEALLGAIYLDYGYKKCKKFVETRLLKTFINIDTLIQSDVNFKSKLIEWCQKHKYQIEFEVDDESSNGINEHVFHSRLLINNCFICEAKGASKKESHQKAAKYALEMLDQIPTMIQIKVVGP